MSKARLFDGVPLARLGQPSSQDMFPIWSGRKFIEECLAEVFTAHQLSLIESAFEQTAMGLGVGSGEKVELYRAAYFGSRYHNSYERVKAIMENIVANGGVFTPF